MGTKSKHGMCGTKLYTAWANMKKRINNPSRRDGVNYKNIKYCKEWEEFVPFMQWAIANGYEEGLSLERIDVFKDYTPDNCKWIPVSEQQYNKTNTKWITYNGKTQALSKWALELGIARDTLKSRILRGWSIERAFTEPLGVGRYEAAISKRKRDKYGKFM